ncbi:MAG: tRNA lysidine(34) synthetase TilS [Pseudomonadota bacterium]|jgi:tRNA(Ile)-lysidine synthase
MLRENLDILERANTIWIAYSGGLDSQVLLHLCAHSIYRSQVKAIHVHHGLSKNANQWVKYCEETCQTLEIPLVVKYLQICRHKKESLEEIARKERYRLFEELLEEKDVLLMAHHADDQVETFLLRALRGAGVEGLSAIPQQRKLGKGILYRPLLNFSRIELQKYAHENNLKWIEDESNQSEVFDRNFLRKQIIPILKNRWKGLEKTLCRTAHIQTETAQLLFEIASEDLIKCQSNERNILDIKELLQLSEQRRANLLRCWLKSLGFEIPSRIKMQQIQEDILLSKIDRQPCVSWEGVEIRRYRHNLYAMSPLPPKILQPIEFIWDLKNTLKLPFGELKAGNEKFGLPNNTYQIRFRKGGETCFVYGQHHEVKKLLQEKGVPTWFRPFIPLIYHENILVAIPNVVIADKWRIENGIRPDWKF